jgi:glycosyltransferase involved in cell wall biosynthesis
MVSQQELLLERERLKRRLAEQEHRIRQLEGSTALVLARRLHGIRRQVLWLLKLALFANRVRRRLMGIRIGLPAPDMRLLDVEFPAGRIDPARETVLLISHEASQTGAPILAWNIASQLSQTFNVVTVLILGGVLAHAFDDVSAAVVGPLGIETHQPLRARKVAFQLARRYKPLFAIANTAESRYLASPLAQEGIPVVSLIHEFAASLSPKMTMQQVFDWSAEIVFPAALVRDSFLPEYKSLSYKTTRLLPQGQSILPPAMRRKPSHAGDDASAAELAAKLRPLARDSLVVVGMGPADFRKGADLFIATAHIAKRLAPDANIRWVWIGNAHDPVFFNYIGEQLHRSNLQHDLALIDTVDDIDTVYDTADLLYISSRMDPLPNVAIDMMLKGKPVLCFDQASGVAEILKSLPETAELAVPYLDMAKAGEIVIDLAAHRDRVHTMGAALREKARALFDMPRYVAELIVLGREAAKKQVPRADNRALFLEPGNFDVPLYLGTMPDRPGMREEAVDHYLNYADKVGTFRRALAGFHPRLYAEQVAEVNRHGWSDPLAHFLRAGRPRGPWLHRVMRLDGASAKGRRQTPAALHGHFHYTDNIHDFMGALAANDGVYDLFLTTGNEARRGELRRATQGHKGKVTIEIVPNRGRDIGPFIEVLKTHIVGKYDIVGHIHGKRSPHAHSLGPNVGEIWRVFLWEHLIGPEVAAADIIVEALRADPALGLVFPEDPNIIGWDENRPFAEDLARQMGFATPLPQHIDFPVGTMFWARTEAMQPLLRLNLTWEDYPPEPLPVDGSMLHALERLLPGVAAAAGFTFATTYLPGVGR